MIFAFLLCRCCFIEFPALLIPKSLKKNLLISILKFNWSGKNALQDYLIVGKQCVCQMATFLVDYSSRTRLLYWGAEGKWPQTENLKWNLSQLLGNLVVEVSAFHSVTQTAAHTTKQELTKRCYFWDCSWIDPSHSGHQWWLARVKMFSPWQIWEETCSPKTSLLCRILIYFLFAWFSFYRFF